LVVRPRVIIVLPLSRKVITFAAWTATQKVNRTDRGFARRNLAQILQNTFQGDLAKNAFIEWLLSQGIPFNRIWEYDEVRPHFRSYNPLGYPLKVTKNNGHEVTIDVNSSMPHGNQTDQDIIDNFDVKVKAGSRGQSLRDPLQLRAEVYVQIYVRPNVEMPRIEPEELRDALLAEETRATERILQIRQAYRGDILFGFAWATRNDVDRFKRQFESRGETPTWTFWRISRIYWKCPIRGSQRLQTLISYLT
jgi:hypothetical protein